MAWTLYVDVGLVLTGSISAQDKMAIRTCCASLLLASNVVYRFGYTPNPFVGKSRILHLPSRRIHKADHCRGDQGHQRLLGSPSR
jgi:membrane protein DedA with SNARE-associated domain